MTGPLRRRLPNGITVLRLILAAAFFVALEGYQTGRTGPVWANVAIVLFVAAAVTDALDGYLARRWQVISTFGRIMDPLCDKVLVLGAFIYLAGPRFILIEEPGGAVVTTTGVAPWMVVVILARELLVTGVRSVAEAVGVKFPSSWWGKAKMILQTIAIPAVLLIAVNEVLLEQSWAVPLRDGLVWTTVAFTFASGVPYATRFARAMHDRGRDR